MILTHFIWIRHCSSCDFFLTIFVCKTLMIPSPRTQEMVWMDKPPDQPHRKQCTVLGLSFMWTVDVSRQVIIISLTEYLLMKALQFDIYFSVRLWWFLTAQNWWPSLMVTRENKGRHVLMLSANISKWWQIRLKMWAKSSRDQQMTDMMALFLKLSRHPQSPQFNLHNLQSNWSDTFETHP